MDEQVKAYQSVMKVDQRASSHPLHQSVRKYEEVIDMFSHISYDKVMRT